MPALFAALREVIRTRDAARIDDFVAPIDITCAKPDLSPAEARQRHADYQRKVREGVLACGSRFDWATAELVGIAYGQPTAPACDGRLVGHTRARAHFVDVRDRFELVPPDGHDAPAPVERCDRVEAAAAACASRLDKLDGAAVVAKARNASRATSALPEPQRAEACAALPADPCAAWSATSPLPPTSTALAEALLGSTFAAFAARDLDGLDPLLASDEQLTCAGRKPIDRARLTERSAACAIAIDWASAELLVLDSKPPSAAPARCGAVEVRRDLSAVVADGHQRITIDVDALVVAGQWRLASPVRCELDTPSGNGVFYDLTPACEEHLDRLARDRAASFEAYAAWSRTEPLAGALHSFPPDVSSRWCDALRATAR